MPFAATFGTRGVGGFRVVALCVILMLLARPADALAGQEPPAAFPLSQEAVPDPVIPGNVLPTWQRTMYKTITYQTLANVADLVAFDLLVGGTAATTGSFFALNAASAAALYYGFEYAWQSAGPSLDETTERTLVEKTILYRFINVGRNFALGYSFGGGAAVASAFGAANLVYDTTIFVANEYAWDILRPAQAP